MGTLILTREDVKKVIDMSETIEAVKEVYQLKAAGKSVVWPLVNYEFTDESAAMDIRSGYVKGIQLHGLKMLNNFPLNREKGLEPFNGIMMVYDSDTGIPIGILDASYITCMRTGAAGAIGADALARKDAKVLTLVGTGKQALFQIAATLILRPQIKLVQLVNALDFAFAEEFATRLKEKLESDFHLSCDDVEFTPVASMEEAIGKSDIIITVTPSRKPIVKKEWLKPGTHLSCLGSDMETKQEIESTIFEGAKIFTDDKAQCIRVGEIEIPIKQGVISEKDITGEIGELLSGKVEGRNNDEEITVFDATGLYILDLVTAKPVIDKAKKLGIGTEVDF